MDDFDVLTSLRAEDGALVEVVCEAFDGRHWPALLALAAARGWAVNVWDDEQSIDLGAALEQAPTFDGHLTVSLTRAGQAWTSTLWSADGLDIQGDPEQIQTMSDLGTVRELMEMVRDTSGSSVLFVAETMDYASTTPYLELTAPS